MPPIETAEPVEENKTVAEAVVEVTPVVEAIVEKTPVETVIAPVLETAYEKDLDEKKPVVVSGVKGVKSKPFSKKFKSMAHFNAWHDKEENAGNHEIHHVTNESAEDEAHVALAVEEIDLGLAELAEPGPIAPVVEPVVEANKDKTTDPDEDGDGSDDGDIGGDDDVDVKEGVEVNHARYLKSHGKRAKGTGNWMFTHHEGGVDPDTHKEGEDYMSHNGSFGDASKKAAAWAKGKGKRSVYVAESSEEGEAPVLESFEFAGELDRAMKRKIKKIEGAIVEAIDDKFFAVQFPTDKMDAVKEALSDKLVGGDASIHLVKEGAGKSFFRVLSESGFEPDNVSAIASIFEAAVNERVAAREEAFDARVTERVEQIEDKLAEELETIATEFVAEWMTENSVAITSNIRLSLAEEMVSKIKSALTEAGVDLPESKLAAYDTLEESHTVVLSEVETLKEENVTLAQELNALRRGQVVRDLVEEKNLTFVQKERLEKMLEDFDGDFESFTEKANTVVETFFNDTARKQKDGITMANDVISESAVVVADKKQDPYAAFLRRGNRGGL